MSPWRRQPLLHARAVLLKPQDERGSKKALVVCPLALLQMRETSLTLDGSQICNQRPYFKKKKSRTGEMKSPSLLDKLVLRSAEKSETFGEK